MKRTLLMGMMIVLGLDVCAKMSLGQSSNMPSTAPSTAPSGVEGYEPAPTVPLPEGMTPLFNGKSLDNWVQVPANSWMVKDGAICSLGIARGVIYTSGQYESYRLIFDVRHASGKPDHPAGVLFFCTNPPAGENGLDALGAIQFQVPNGNHWDYRKGHNNDGKTEFTSLTKPKLDQHQWSRVEILVDMTSGTARLAVAQPAGSKAVEITDFKDPTAAQKGPIALQMHNKGLFDEYANIAIEVNPKNNDLITVK